MAGLFGWEGDLPEAGAHQEAWDEAEAATDRIVGRALAALERDERIELVELVEALGG
jgi:hypothetical protein